MGLTRPRAYQIYDIDYKQAVRVITLTNITLSGGAPSQVDSVNLSLNDRVLVAGQNTASQNGLYYVTTVGTGSNGTWARSIDGNETGEIQAGMIVMVTEGTIYHDSQWKLTTNDPIVIGSSALVFEQSSAYSFGTISVSGQANVVADTVGDVLTFAAGNNISLTTDAGSDTVTIAVTGISLNSISNGSSNVNVVSSGGNVSVGVGGTSNVAVFSSTGATISGDLTVTGNATLSGNILGDRIQNGNTQIDIQTQNGNANITVGGIANVAVFSTAGQNVTGYLTASGNITGGNLVTTGQVSATGNITGGNIIGVGSSLTGINAFGTISVSGQSDVVADSTSDTLTLAAGTGIAITTTAGSDTITISSAATDSIFATGGDMGTISESVTSSEDLGSITSAATVAYDLGTETTGGILTPSLLLLPSYTVAGLGSVSASPAGQFVYCSDESGGAVPAFSDGTNWRRVTDRAIVS